VVENRSISDLDEERGDLDGLARRLGYAAGNRESSARRALQDDYAHHTHAIRRSYLEILGVAGLEAPA
jgi:UDP-N-acetylmuramate-alanine ligase